MGNGPSSSQAANGVTGQKSISFPELRAPVLFLVQFGVVHASGQGLKALNRQFWRWVLAEAGVTGLILAKNQLTSLALAPGLLWVGLKRLELPQNHLTDLPVLALHFPNLTQLDLSQNELGSSISKALRDLTDLSELVLADASITRFSSNLARSLSSLQTLRLTGNPLRPHLCHVALVPSLRRLHLDNCGLEQPPPGLAQLPNLMHLTLGHNQLHGFNPLEEAEAKEQDEQEQEQEGKEEGREGQREQGGSGAKSPSQGTKEEEEEEGRKGGEGEGGEDGGGEGGKGEEEGEGGKPNPRLSKSSPQSSPKLGRKATPKSREGGSGLGEEASKSHARHSAKSNPNSSPKPSPKSKEEEQEGEATTKAQARDSSKSSPKPSPNSTPNSTPNSSPKPSHKSRQKSRKPKPYPALRYLFLEANQLTQLSPALADLPHLCYLDITANPDLLQLPPGLSASTNFELATDLPSQVDPDLFLSGVDSLAMLDRLGFTHVISICPEVSEAETSRAHHLPHLLIPVLDFPNEPLYKFLPEAFQFLAQVEQSGGRLLVHCYAGVSRSASLVIAIVMARRQTTCAQAHRAVKACRPIIDPGFLHQMRRFEGLSAAEIAALSREELEARMRAGRTLELSFSL